MARILLRARASGSGVGTRRGRPASEPPIAAAILDRVAVPAALGLRPAATARAFLARPRLRRSSRPGDHADRPAGAPARDRRSRRPASPGAKLALYGGALLAIGVVGGVFRFWTRRILIGASRDIEYDMRNDFFAHLQTLPLSYFQAHRTGDLMSRATNDLNAVRMMIGPSIMYSANTHPDVRRGAGDDAGDRRAADAAVAHSAAVRVDLGQGTSAAPFISGFERSRRSCPRSARSRRRRCPASASCAPTGRRTPRSSDFGAPTRNICGATAG